MPRRGGAPAPPGPGAGSSARSADARPCAQRAVLFLLLMSIHHGAAAPCPRRCACCKLPRTAARSQHPARGQRPEAELARGANATAVQTTRTGCARSRTNLCVGHYSCSRNLLKYDSLASRASCTRRERAATYLGTSILVVVVDHPA